jgi:phosphoribosylglycinamide formyltransferase-1
VIRRIAVLISGRGSNLQSIIDAIAAGRLDASIAVVISNRAEAPGMVRAREAGIETLHLSRADYPDRDAYDRAIVDAVTSRGVDLICLAGFMQLVGPPLLDAYSNRILNIHPSLLPAFPGLHTHRRALEAGVKVHGASVHLVTAALDGGPVIIQGVVPVMAGDTEEKLAARVLEVEHRIYPQAVRWMGEGRIESTGGVVQVRGAGVSTDTMVSPRNPQ